jgi:ABC-type lipoprotein release transport system permease subunit
MRSFSIFKFVLRRLADDWKLLLCIFSGIFIASTLVAGAPAYLNSLGRLTLNIAIDRSPQSFVNMMAIAPNVPLIDTNLHAADAFLDRAIADHISDFYTDRERYIKSSVLLMGTPRNPLSRGASEQVTRGYLQYLSNVEHHVMFEEGRMSTGLVVPGERGPIIEAVLSTASSELFSVSVGEQLQLTPSQGNATVVTMSIVGIMSPVDETEGFWQQNARVFLDPGPLEEAPDLGVIVEPEEPPLVAFVTEDALLNGIGVAFPGTLISSTWFISVDKELLKIVPPKELASRIEGMQTALAKDLQGSALFTGTSSLLTRYERRSFFSAIPLLLLMSIMAITVLYFMAMMISYLVQSREYDVALLRSRGITTLHMVKIYALEGVALTVIAVLSAPFLAMALIALSGKLPYFGDITDGDMLPVELKLSPFLVAGAVGVLSLAIYVVPGVIGARAGLIIHKLRSSRPPLVPAFQRYYLDVLLLVLGGLVFWELNARGQLISGGLFKDIEVNEALLLAPVLMLTLVALLFMRFFPLVVRYVSGESSGLAHLFVWAGSVSMFVALASDGFRTGNPSGSLPIILLVGAIGGVYWLTHKSSSNLSRLFGIFSQAVLVSLVVWLETPQVGSLGFVPSMVLMAVVPSQVLYLILKRLSRNLPIWVTMGLWHMARNPLQYSWLVLLLVMITGLGVLATTVGGTLNRSYQERVLYDTVADIRVTGIPARIAGGPEALKAGYSLMPGVRDVSLGFRESGILGANYSGLGFQVLGVDAQEFQYFAWYRDDFSEHTLPEVMRALLPVTINSPIEMPDDSAEIGLFLRPEFRLPNVFVWVVIQDALGTTATISLGEVGEPEWHRLDGPVPARLVSPLELVSVQIFEPVFGPTGTPGAIAFDDIHVLDSHGEVFVVENFEDNRTPWLALATSSISVDTIHVSDEDALFGERSGVFRFGKDTDNGIRGIYRSPGGGPVPIVASSSFMELTGTLLGDPIIVQIRNRFIPVVVQDVVDYFPTLNPRDSGFIIADMETLIAHINMLGIDSTTIPNELYISQAPAAGLAVRNIVLRMVGQGGVNDREMQMEELRLDPLITAGWQAMVLLAALVIIFTAGLGYVTYLLAFAERSRSEMGFLQSLGLSRSQMTRLITMEHLVIVVIGLTLGTVTGWITSNLMVSSVAVTEDGLEVIPPFILHTDLGFLLPIYAALIGIFLLSIYRLTMSMRHVNLRTIARMESD